VTYRWFVNGIINASGQTLNRTNYRYNSSVVCEANNTLGSDSILLNSSTLYISDGSAPVLTYWNTSSNNISTGTALTLYANASDYGTVTECRAEVYDNATDATTNHTLAWNGSLWRANIVPSYAGLLNYSALHCVDGSGNWAHNWGVNLTVTVTGPTIPAGGGSTGGGEGGNPPATTTIVNNYGVNASYSFTVLPAVVKPVDTADFLPGSMANRVVQVENKETFDLDMHFIISGNASKYCTMLENVSTPTMQKRSIAVSCTMGAETNEGETYVGNITVVACKPSTSTQCDSRTVSLLLPLAKARQTQLAASIPEDLDNIWQWFAGLRLIEQAEENPIPYGAAFIGLCLLALSFLLMFDLKTGIISRLL
jgi:hypothetical protein